MPEMKRRGFLKAIAGAPLVGPAILKGKDLSEVEQVKIEVEPIYVPREDLMFSCSTFFWPDSEA
jgi:hypothetical protein